jgi:hypothetical protein
MRLLPVAVLVACAGFVSACQGRTGTDWQALHRAIHLPALAAGERCPASKRAPEVAGKKYGVEGAIGPGPVYPILGRPGLLAVVRQDEWGPGPWAGQKVLWFVLPAYKGPVLIRGRRLGGRQWMRFDNGAKPRAEIRLAQGETVKWTGQAPGSRGRPSYVRVRAAGCYGVQIDGTTFSRVVVFPIDISR